MAKALKLAITSAKGRGDTRATTDDLPATRTGRYTDPSYQVLSVRIPRELHRRVKAAAAEQGREMSGFVEELLRDRLSR